MAPALTLTVAGVLSIALLAASVTARPPVGAAALTVTVQALIVPDVSDVGAQTNVVTFTGGAKLNEAVLELPFNVAVTTAVTALETVAAVAVKEPVVAAAAIVRLAGTVRLALLLARAMAAPPVGAGPLKVTVQALVAGPVNVAGLQARLLTVVGALKLIKALADPPLAVAVTVAVPVLVIVPAETGKLADLAPAATVTDAGVVSSELLSERVTTVPADGAALLRVTVQLLVPPELIVAGLQASAVGMVGAKRPV